MATKTKQRVHGEYFRPVALGNRKSCPTCKVKLPPGESVWSWGEYHIGKWRTVKHFCINCYLGEVQTKLIAHRQQCGCEIELRMYHSAQPHWLRWEIVKPGDQVSAKILNQYGRFDLFVQVTAVDGRTITGHDVGGNEHTFHDSAIVSVNYDHPHDE